MGDGRDEGSSAIGDGVQTVISLTPDIDGTSAIPFWIQLYLSIPS